MNYKCEICGASLKSKKSANSPAHINSQKHKLALEKKDGPKIIQPIHSNEIDINRKILGELILYQALTTLSDPAYTKIIDFFSSFGFNNDEIINILFKKLKEGDVGYSDPKDSDLIYLYNNLLHEKELRIPLIFKIVEVYERFKGKNFSNVLEMVEFFKKMRDKYPEVIGLSSSQIGNIEDLISFKRIFPDYIKFRKQQRWLL